MQPYRITQPSAPEIPIIVSIPHCGVAFPKDLQGQYKSALITAPDDTDWFVDELYSFAPSLGITMISAVYSRWLIDLNRDPQSKPLYNDGRIITGLCPTTDFLGNPIYLDERKEVESIEVDERLMKYYWPYHHKLQEMLNEKIKNFGFALLWDCHSIRQEVPSIFKGKFPDLILGDANETSASSTLIQTALQLLSSGPYSFSHNYPFKGGYITRAYGNPKNKIHALQLEMTKVNYMDDSETDFHPERAKRIQSLLASTFVALAKKISAL